jgi:hypothetical protein
MQRIPVVSKTGMTGRAYVPATQTLEISFVSRKEGEPDKVYQYSPFTQEQWDTFLSAESTGSHFLKIIKPRVKPGDLTCVKIEPEKKAEDAEV